MAKAGYHKDSILAKLWFPAGFAFTGVLTICISNNNCRRPIFAGIQRHIAFGLAGALLGYYSNIYLERKWMKRDAIIRHYIELHPEDFKEEKRQYKEVFDAWMPCR